MKNKGISRKFAAAYLSKETKRFIIVSDWFNSFDEAQKYGDENIKKYVVIENSF